jgi:hypothetical protein
MDYQTGVDQVSTASDVQQLGRGHHAGPRLIESFRTDWLPAVSSKPDMGKLLEKVTSSVEDTKQ